MIIKEINLDNNYHFCVKARRESFYCSFGNLIGFDKIICGYKNRIKMRLKTPGFHYYHVWLNDQIVGQLEFCSTWEKMNVGYIYLIYIEPQFRGSGLADELHGFILNKLLEAGCHQAVLSVSNTNKRAVSFYRKHHWRFLRKNYKHKTTDYFKIKLS
ncbi:MULTISPECIES: GNAT family N-acetyltransferase [Aeromonas]|uniref:GNAT family N-acetyltransferase n=1 Tax=Aeromonas bestiarum TaxID=105751 RepID=A0ABT7Q3D7_9GAMM|nr:GNAT family N-acetyltransferase [Aeromonas bestiarum]MDM5073848.1 GNAT family N-acetyltransferase [Aeromonas bestiarum]